MRSHTTFRGMERRYPLFLAMSYWRQLLPWGDRHARGVFISQLQRRLDDHGQYRRCRSNKCGVQMKRLVIVIFGLCGWCLANSYTTSFPATENPISESGHWVGGQS